MRTYLMHKDSLIIRQEINIIIIIIVRSFVFSIRKLHSRCESESYYTIIQYDEKFLQCIHVCLFNSKYIERTHIIIIYFYVLQNNYNNSEEKRKPKLYHRNFCHTSNIFITITQTKLLEFYYIPYKFCHDNAE